MLDDAHANRAVRSSEPFLLRPENLNRRKRKASMKIGFIGLGQMGRGMAARLLARGHELVAWNRTQSAGDALRARGAIIVDSADDALDTEVVITMLADDAAVEAVWLDSNLVAKL